MANIGLIGVLLFVIAIVPSAFGAVCVFIARRRQLREPGWWFCVGAILGPLGWLAAALWPNTQPR